MVTAVHGHFNPTLIDTGDSEASEMADQIRSHHNIVVIDTPQGESCLLASSSTVQFILPGCKGFLAKHLMQT